LLIDFALKQVLPQRDVDIQEPMGSLRRGNEYEGALTYIHKVRNGHDIYFFANSSPKAIDTKVVLRQEVATDLEPSQRWTGGRRIESVGGKWTGDHHGAAGSTRGVLALFHPGIDVARTLESAASRLASTILVSTPGVARRHPRGVAESRGRLRLASNRQ
jgi:hypothetical protein